jgi:cytochrome P450
MLYLPPVWLCSIAIFLTATAYVRYRRLSSIPGPFLASVTDIWRFVVTRKGKFPERLARLHEQYGPFVRIGPNSVAIADPAAIPVIHSMHGEFRKADTYSPLRALVNGKLVGSVVDMQDEKEVSALKRAVGAAFATKNLLDYEPDVDHALETLVAAMRKRKTVSLMDAMQQFQADFLMKAAFSIQTDYLETDQSTAGITGEPRLKHWYGWQSMPGLDYLLFKSPLSPTWWRSKTSNPPVWSAMARDEFEKRRRWNAKEKAATIDSRSTDLLSKYLFGADRHKETVSDELILRMVSSTIAAGFDTSAFTMTAIIYELLKYPESMKRLSREIKDAIRGQNLSSHATFTDADKLEYLSAVIKETMRLQVFVQAQLDREVPAGGTEVAGKYLPGGTIVSISVVPAHRDLAVFGRNPDHFRPERWIEADHQQKILMERSVLGFGAGKRVCLGRHIAELEMKKVIPRLLMEFDVSHSTPFEGHVPG